MTFSDLIHHQTEKNTGLCHECPRFLSRSVARVTPTMHKIRRACFFTAIESMMNSGALSATGLGRNISSMALERHRIKRMDRLCGNVKF